MLSPHQRRGPNSIGRSCRNDQGDTDDHLWVAFADPSLVGKPREQRLGANAARIDVGEAHLARLEVAVAKTLIEQPHDLATAILVDGSRSMRSDQVEAQRAL